MALLGLSAGPVLAQSKAASAALPAGVSRVTSVEGITEYQLKNGLRVLLFPDQSKPTATVNMTYLVGSRHEGYGESGHGPPAGAHGVQGLDQAHEYSG